MSDIIRYNYEKDFIVTVELPEIVGDSDFRVDLFTKGNKVYTASRTKGVYSKNIRKTTTANQYKIVLRKHAFPEGELKARGYCWLSDGFSPDGIMQEPIVVELPKIELWTGASD